MRKKILIDTDCGVDDSIAIMIALAAENIDVMGITTVSGNTYVNQVTDNVLRLLSYLGYGNIPVYRGAHRPLVAVPKTGERIHGDNGLGNVELPRTAKSVEGISAPEAIYRIAKENPGIIFVTLGPLTNIAMAFNLYPDLKDLVKEIVAMGGALYKGNVTRFAEFNFYFDPEAAQYVFNTGVPMKVLPWDPVEKLPFMEDELKGLFGVSGDIGNIKNKAVRFFFEVQQVTISFIEKFHGIRATMLPDPETMAYVVDDTVALRKMQGGFTMELNYNTLRGASILEDSREMEIVTEVNRESFLKVLKFLEKL